MIPNADLIERWSSEDGDGYVKIPASAWPELLWVLRQAEKAETVVLAAQALSDAHKLRAASAASWTLREQDTLHRLQSCLIALEHGSRSFGS